MRYKDAVHDWIYITADEAQKLITHLRPEHWHLPVKLLYHYGLRASELLSLTPLNFKNGELIIQRLKNGRLTRQYLVPEVRVPIEELCRTRISTVRLFPFTRISLWRAIQEAGNRAGVDPRKAHPHAFRHAAGRRWAKQGSLMELSAMLGHKTAQATLLYTRLECDVELSKKFLE